MGQIGDTGTFPSAWSWAGVATIVQLAALNVAAELDSSDVANPPIPSQRPQFRAQLAVGHAASC